MGFLISAGPLPTRRALLPAFDAAVAAREGAPSDGQPTGQPGTPDVPSVSKRVGESRTFPPPLHKRFFTKDTSSASFHRQHVSAILPPGWLCYGRFSAARMAGHISISLCASAILCIGRRVCIGGREQAYSEFKEFSDMGCVPAAGQSSTPVHALPKRTRRETEDESQGESR